MITFHAINDPPLELATTSDLHDWAVGWYAGQTDRRDGPRLTRAYYLHDYQSLRAYTSGYHAGWSARHKALRAAGEEASS